MLLTLLYKFKEFSVNKVSESIWWSILFVPFCFLALIWFILKQSVRFLLKLLNYLDSLL